MSNPQIAASTDGSNIANIMDQIIAIARDHSGIPWTGTSEWDFPPASPPISSPYLVVTWPQFVEYSVGYVPVGEFMSRSMEVQFTWDIDVWCIAPYSPGNPKTYSTPTNAATKLLSTFTLYENLNGTCDEMRVGKPQLLKISQKPPNGNTGGNGPPLWFAALLTLRVIEDINTVY